jgi:chemotaxis protein MotA
MALVVSAIVMGGDVNIFIDVPSLMIVFGGTFGTIFVAFPFEEVRQALKAGFTAFSSRKVQVREVVNIMVKIAEISRREGLIALENVKTENMVLKKACQLIADNADPALIRTTLAIEITSMKRRHKVGEEVFKRLGSLAPSFGMLGTLIGLVQMLANLNDPKAIGPAMAVAIITTFYGSTLATVIFLPSRPKLKAALARILHLEVFRGRQVHPGKQQPKLVHEKLSSFLARETRGR